MDLSRHLSCLGSGFLIRSSDSGVLFTVGDFALEREKAQPLTQNHELTRRRIVRVRGDTENWKAMCKDAAAWGSSPIRFWISAEFCLFSVHVLISEQLSLTHTLSTLSHPFSLPHFW